MDTEVQVVNMENMMSKLFVAVAIAITTLLWPTQAIAQNGSQSRIDLSGQWRFALDRTDSGVKEQFYNQRLKDTITLPGVLQSQNYGDEISAKTPWVLSLYDRNWNLRADYKAYATGPNVRVPFLSQPPRHYLGVAWYQRDITIPTSSKDRRTLLTLERPHWETTVWLDDQKIGSNNSLCAPHVFDLGMVSPGTHTITIRVDNRMIMPYRPDAHGVSDSLGSSWNGIAGRVDLTTTSLVWIDDAQVFPNIANKTANVKVKFGNSTGQPGTGTLSAMGQSIEVKWDKSGGAAELLLKFNSNTKLWDEFTPALQKVSLKLTGPPADDSRELTFGLREIRAVGKDFLVNGRPTNFRGTHHGGDFPLTGYPSTDVEYWRKLIKVCRSFGLNHIRFHSFAPPDAAFVAADELGFYLAPEPGMWNEISPGTPMEKMLYEESERMIKAYGNHPSFILFSASNEPKGNWQKSLGDWVEHYRKVDPRRLYVSGTGHTEREIPNITDGNDFLAIQRIGPKMLRRESAWFGADFGASLTEINIPVVSHETGQWVAYPDYDVIKKFTGYMRPGNYEIFRDSMAAHGLLHKNKEFAWASGRYQLECYKEEIEANLRTPGLSGFQLLDLHDYLGQGTALVGVLDAFWESKGYATAEEFRKFCNVTVPLARLKRVFTTDDKFDVDVEVAHFGAAPIERPNPEWKILDSKGAVVVDGGWTVATIPIGKNIKLGKVNVDLSKLPAPARYKLSVSVGTTAQNDWNFWLYPAETKTPATPGVLVTSSWDEAEKKLADGGKVLFTPRNVDLDWTSPPLDNVPVFWNRLMGPAWGRMLGILVNTKHPAMAKFPSDPNFDWQWVEIIRNVRAVNMDRLPRQLEPVVWAIDDWNRNYKLGLVFEAKVGNGRLLVSSFPLDEKAIANPVARQLRHSLLSYASGSRFQPRVAVTRSQLRGLFFPTRIMNQLSATADADAVGSNPASSAIDGDPNTYWFVGDQRRERQSRDLTLSFANNVPMSGLVVMARQNHREHEGDIREYVISVSEDGKKWTELKRGQLESTFDPQTIRFAKPISTRYLRFTALSGFGQDKTVALAELAVVYTGPKLGDDGKPLQYQRSRTATPEIDEGPAPVKKP